MDDDSKEFYLEIGKAVLLGLVIVGLKYAALRWVEKESRPRRVFEEPKEEDDVIEYIDVDSW